MIKQKTIVDAVTVTGVGVHSGEQATLRIKPAPAGSGIRFVRLRSRREVSEFVAALSASPVKQFNR